MLAVMEVEKLPVILDREINDPSLDAFGHRHYAIALKDLVEENKPPYSVGLLGNWGVGKSSIKELYLHGLQDDISRKSSVLPITFNAWRYGGDNVKRALLRHVYIEIGGVEEELKDKMYHQISEVVLKPRTWKEIFSDFYQRYLWYPSQIVFVLLLTIILYYFLSKGINEPLGKAGIASVLSVVFAAVVKFVLSANGITVPRYSNVTKVYPPSVNSEQYADYLVEQLHKYKKTQNGKQVKRIVVFVDDLDRLSSEEMVEGLDTVRIFMEIPKEKLPAELGIVFVLSCDEDKISYALSNKRNADYLPGSVSNKKDARRYLDRIFQFRLEILPFPKRDLRSYAEGKLLSAMPSFNKEMEDRGIQLSNIVDRLIHPGVQSPRNALQLVNMFMQAWWIAKKREYEGTNTNSTGGLSEGHVTNHPEALAVICALRVDFHYFFEDLLEDHNLIEAFTKTFINKFEDNMDLSERSKRALTKYRKENLGDEQLKEEYFTLRQYLRYVQGIRLPNYLQPIILLSQDSVSRRIGNNRLVYDSLINNDSSAILQEFSVSFNSKKLLPVEFMGAVNEIIEDLQNETDLYITNSSIALGEIVSKFPEENYFAAIGFLCNSLSHFPDIRWKIGLENLAEIYFRSSTAQKVLLTEILIDEFIRSDDIISYKLKSGQNPTIEDLSIFVETAAGMVLKAKYKDALRFKNEDVLFNWLKTRRFTNGKKEDSLPFLKFASWVDEFQEVLYQIGVDYVEEGIKEIELGTQIDKNNFIGSFKFVVDNEWSKGEESRNKVCILFEEGVKAKHEYLCEYVLTQINEKKNELSETHLSNVVIGILDRIQKSEEHTDWALRNYEWYRKMFIDLLSMLNKLPEKMFVLLVTITEYWNNKKETVTDLISVLEIIKEKSTLAFEQIMSNLIELLPENLNKECIEYLGSNYSILTQEQQQHIINYFNPLNASYSIDMDMAKKLGVFLKRINNKALESDILRSLVSDLFSRLHTWSSQHNYIASILPSLSHLISYKNTDNAGQALQTLFTTSNTINDPKIYNRISLSLIDKMPKQSNDLNPYDPEAIFNSAYSVSKRFYESNNVLNVLLLLNSMVRSGVVKEKNDHQVMEIAVLLWQEGYKEETKDIIEENTYPPSEQEFYQLFSSTDFKNPEEKTVLHELIANLSEYNKIEKVNSVSIMLIEALKRDELELWINEHSGNATLLVDLLESKNNDWNNDQLNLLTTLIFEKLSIEEYQVAKQLIKIGIDIFEKDKQRDGVVKLTYENREFINKLFNEETVAGLHETLLIGLIKTSSVSIKRSLSNWLLEAKAGVFLKSVKKYNPSKEDIGILLEVFGKSKSLMKIINE